MPVLQLLLLVLAVILLALAGVGVHAGRVHLGWVGLAVAVFAIGVLPELTG